MKKNIIVHPLLFSVMPILALFEHNQDIASPYYLIQPILLTVLVTIIFFYLINFFINNPQKSSLLVSIGVISFFFFVDWAQFFSWLDVIIPGDKLYYKSLSSIIYLIIFIGVAALIQQSKKNFQKLNTILNLFSAIVIGLQILSIISYQIKNSSDQLYLKTTQNDIYKQTSKPLENLPDIYYIVLDGYGRQDVYQNLYNYDNSDFIKYLESKNFYVASQATTNYTKTFMSVPSTLNMNYIEEIKKASGATVNDRKFFRNIIKENLVSNILDKHGYTFVTLPYTWFGNYENLKSDIHIKAKHEQNDFNTILISQTPLYALAVPLELRSFQDKNMEILEAIPKISAFPVNTFSYIHLMASHPPFIFDENGPVKKVNPECLNGADGSDYYKLCPGVEKFRQDLQKQVSYFNKRFEEIIDQIISSSATQPIIIIQGDHGPGSAFHQSSLEQSDIAERISILNTYLVPAEIKKELYPQISPVNSFRLILNHLLGYDFEKLEDKNYFVIDGAGNHLIEVTDQIKNLNKQN